MNTARTRQGVAYISHGQGTPIVMLHGFPLDHRALLPLDPVIAQHGAWRRLYIDLPGMGASAACTGIDGAQAVLDTVSAPLDEILGQQPFALIGYSFGGMLARAIASARARQVLGLCLLCPEIVPDRAARSVPSLRRKRPLPAFLDTLNKADRSAYLHTAVVLSPDNWQLFHQFILPGLQRFNPQTIAAIGQAASLKLASSAMQHPGPALLLGRQDNMVGYKDALPLLELYPRLSLAILDGGGHTLHLDCAEAVAMLLSRWLSALPPPQ